MGGEGRKTLPEYDRASLPEEKLRTYGAEVLSDSELLALFLRTGTEGRTAIDVAQDILDSLEKKSPSRRGLSSLFTGTYDDFIAVKGIGKSKAARLVGMVEMARRMRRPMESAFLLDSPKAVAEFVAADCMGLRQEEFRVLGLDAKKQLQFVECISKGTLDCAVVHPRDVFQGAIAKKCHSILLVHNHPAGNPQPSEEDRALTRRLKKAGEILGIPVVDHVIIGEHRFYSFLEDGAL
ncbi:MAG: DNA repair protein RadC [Peptoniphilus sp.]|nr:DNA repair protein RadC [Peptoniphilus sp.]MDY3118542.1 DNA repair protein RadC [Peptoniphilus sp.]